MALQCLHWPSILLQPELFKLHSVLDRSGRGNIKEICGEDVKVVKSLKGIIEDPDVELVSPESPCLTTAQMGYGLMGILRSLSLARITLIWSMLQQLLTLGNMVSLS